MLWGVGRPSHLKHGRKEEDCSKMCAFPSSLLGLWFFFFSLVVFPVIGAKKYMLYKSEAEEGEEEEEEEKEE